MARMGYGEMGWGGQEVQSQVIVVIDGYEMADFAPVAKIRDGVCCGRRCFFIRSRVPTRALCLPGHEPRNPCLEYQDVDPSRYGAMTMNWGIDCYISPKK